MKRRVRRPGRRREPGIRARTVREWTATGPAGGEPAKGWPTHGPQFARGPRPMHRHPRVSPRYARGGRFVGCGQTPIALRAVAGRASRRRPARHSPLWDAHDCGDRTKLRSERILMLYIACVIEMYRSRDGRSRCGPTPSRVEGLTRSGTVGRRGCHHRTGPTGRAPQRHRRRAPVEPARRAGSDQQRAEQSAPNRPGPRTGVGRGQRR